MPRFVLSIAGVLLVALAVGCGGDSSSTGTDASAIKPFTIPAPKAKVVYERELKPKASGLVGSEPKPYIPDTPPPEELALQDLQDGIGDVAAAGEQMTVQYVGFDYETGKKFVSTWEQGRPFTFLLGAGEVIPAWEEGLVGMEVGDSRELVVPADQAEGPYPPGIPKGKAVVFVVEMLPESSAAKAERAPGGKSKPKVEAPGGPPPKQLEIKDLEAGEGPAAKAGDEVTVQYVGVDYESDKQFDASWDRGEPFTFTLGAGEVIKGWDKGIEGMKAGGRRELIVPPALAYGSEGVGGIAPNSTLVFVVDLLTIN